MRNICMLLLVIVVLSHVASSPVNAEPWKLDITVLPEIRLLRLQQSRVSENIPKDDFYEGQLLIATFEGVPDHIAKKVRITLVADKPMEDRGRSRPFSPGEVFPVFTPTNDDRGYYIGRFHFGDKEGLDAMKAFAVEAKLRAPKAVLRLRFASPDEIGDGVLLCENPGHTGASVFVRAGQTVDLAKQIIREDDGGKNFSDQISSVKVYGRCRYTLAKKAGLDGERRTLIASVPDLRRIGYNDRVRSIKVESRPVIQQGPIKKG